MRQSLQQLLLIKHSKRAYQLDFAVYFSLIGGITTYLILSPAQLSMSSMLLCILLGSLSWTLIEYLLHRWLLHQWPPFSGWHDEHHRQPDALICTATMVSLGTIAITVYLPLYWGISPAVATCFTLGLLMGYLAYAVTHHAIHHWPHRDMAWLRTRQRIHRLHHRFPQHAFGVTSSVWDHALGTTAMPPGGTGATTSVGLKESRPE